MYKFQYSYYSNISLGCEYSEFAPCKRFPKIKKNKLRIVEQNDREGYAWNSTIMQFYTILSITVINKDV